MIYQLPFLFVEALACFICVSFQCELTVKQHIYVDKNVVIIDELNNRNERLKKYLINVTSHPINIEYFWGAKHLKWTVQLIN